VRERGFNHDLRIDKYNMLQQATPETLIAFHAKHIKGRRYTWLVLGDRMQLDFQFLLKIGTITELTLEDIFGE